MFYGVLLFKKLTPEIGVELEKHPLHTMPLCLGISCRVYLLFLIFFLVTCTLCLDSRALLDLPKYWSDSWRRYNLKVACLCVVGDVARQFGFRASSKSPGEQVYLEGFAAKENYVWCLAIVTKLKGLGGANKLGRGRF